MDLLLERGADVNSTMAASEWSDSGYTLLLYRTKMGLDDHLAYADALSLLESGADPNRAGADGMTFEKMLTEHRAQLGMLKTKTVEFDALWDWDENDGYGKH